MAGNHKGVEDMLNDFFNRPTDGEILQIAQNTDTYVICHYVSGGTLRREKKPGIIAYCVHPIFRPH